MVNSTDAVTLSNGNLDEAINTPGSAPRVTDEPVLKAGGLIGAVTDDRDSMVSADSTVSGVEDATRVVVENVATSIN